MSESKKPMSWDDFEIEIRAMYCKGLNPKTTLDKHLTAIRMIRQFAATPAEFNVLALAKLIERYNENGRAQRTIISVLSHLRIQAKYLKQFEVILVNPFSLKRMFPRKGKTSKRSLSVDELTRVFDQADAEIVSEPIGRFARSPYMVRLETKRVWRARRLRALIYLLAFTGVRASEALSIQLKSVSLQDRTIEVLSHDLFRCKTEHSEGLLPLPERAANVVAEWLPFATGRFLFPQATNPNRPWRGGHKRYRPVGEMHALGERCGVPDLTLAIFRHTFTTLGQQVWGLTTAQVQTLLRHTSPLTQENYRHREIQAIKAMVDGKDFKIVTPPSASA